MYQQVTNVSFIKKSLPYYRQRYVELQTRIILAPRLRG